MSALHRQQGYTLVEVLLVVTLIGVVGAMAVPMTGTALAGHRFKSDAQALTNLVGLAKIRASAGFTRARVRVDLATNTFVLERWDKEASQWVPEGGTERTFRDVTFGFAGLSTPPPNTQAAIALSPPCRSGVNATDPIIDNTACILFNSRGLPIDSDGMQFGGHALYMTNGGAVYATTVTATPRIRLWWSGANMANWTEQQ